MLIIRENQNKYEIYNMELIEKKARIYREELIKQTKYYLLNTSFWLTNFYAKYLEDQYKNKIINYAFPISRKKVNYGEKVKPLPKHYSYDTYLYLYNENNLEVKNEKREQFAETYISYGLEGIYPQIGTFVKGSTYYACIGDFEQTDKAKYGIGQLYPACNRDVARLPIEMIALHLLSSYEQLTDDEEMFLVYLIGRFGLKGVIDVFQFTKYSTITKDTVVNLEKLGLMDENRNDMKLKLQVGNSLTNGLNRI